MWNVWGRGNVSARKSEGKKQLGRLGCRWVDNIKMDFQEVVCDMDWIDETQNRDRWRTLVNVVMNHGLSLLAKPRDC